MSSPRILLKMERARRLVSRFEELNLSYSVMDVFQAFRVIKRDGAKDRLEQHRLNNCIVKNLFVSSLCVLSALKIFLIIFPRGGGAKAPLAPPFRTFLERITTIVVSSGDQSVESISHGQRASSIGQ